MPSGSYRQVHVLCPFYQWDDGARRISCEGVMDGVTTITRFGSRAELTQHMTLRCERAYEGCPLYRAVMAEKYSEDGGNVT